MLNFCNRLHLQPKLQVQIVKHTAPPVFKPPIHNNCDRIDQLLNVLSKQKFWVVHKNTHRNCLMGSLTIHVWCLLILNLAIIRKGLQLLALTLKQNHKYVFILWVSGIFWAEKQKWQRRKRSTNCGWAASSWPDFWVPGDWRSQRTWTLPAFWKSLPRSYLIYCNMCNNTVPSCLRLVLVVPMVTGQLTWTLNRSECDKYSNIFE